MTSRVKIAMGVKKDQFAYTVELGGHKFDVYHTKHQTRKWTIAWKIGEDRKGQERAEIAACKRGWLSAELIYSDLEVALQQLAEEAAN